MVVFAFSVSAQNLNTKSVGIIAGSMNGFSVKTQKNPYYYQEDILETYYYEVPTLYCWHTKYPMYKSIDGKSGVNLILGFEYKFSIPLALQLDTRVGTALLFGEYIGCIVHYLDWGLNLGVRYAF